MRVFSVIFKHCDSPLFSLKGVAFLHLLPTDSSRNTSTVIKYQSKYGTFLELYRKIVINERNSKCMSNKTFLQLQNFRKLFKIRKATLVLSTSSWPYPIPRPFHPFHRLCHPFFHLLFGRLHHDPFFHPNGLAPSAHVHPVP